MPVGRAAIFIFAIGAAVVAAVVLLPGDDEPQAPPGGPRFGFNELRWSVGWQSDSDEPLIAAVEVAEIAGADTARMIVPWFDVIDPTGAWDESAWSRYRDAYEALSERGIRPVVTLVGAPRGAAGVQDDPDWGQPGCSPASPSPRHPPMTPSGRRSSCGRRTSSMRRSRSRSGTSPTRPTIGAAASPIPAAIWSWSSWRRPRSPAPSTPVGSSSPPASTRRQGPRSSPGRTTSPRSSPAACSITSTRSACIPTRCPRTAIGPRAQRPSGSRRRSAPRSTRRSPCSRPARGSG